MACRLNKMLLLGAEKSPPTRTNDQAYWVQDFPFFFSKNGPTRRSTAFKAPAIRDVFQSKHAALLVGWEKIIEERTALSKLLILSNMHGCVRLEEWSFLSTITFYGVVESFVKVASLE